MARTKKPLEQLLLERAGRSTQSSAAQAQAVESQTPGKTIAQILLTMNAASEARFSSHWRETLGLAFETPEKNDRRAACLRAACRRIISASNLSLPLRL